MKTRSNLGTKIGLIVIVLILPIFIYAYEPEVSCEPDWKFFGWSRSVCGLNGGSQEVGHKHFPDGSGCVYFYKEYNYFFGFRVDERIAQVVQTCPD